MLGIKGFKQSMGLQSLCPLHNTRGEDESLQKSWTLPTLKHTSDCGEGQEMESIPIWWGPFLPACSQGQACSGTLVSTLRPCAEEGPGENHMCCLAKGYPWR